MSSVLGITDFKQLFPINIDQPQFKIKGWISHPQLARHPAKNQYLFVNSRAVEHKQLNRVIKQTYRQYIPDRTYPPYILWISTSPELLDVNIHPR